MLHTHSYTQSTFTFWLLTYQNLIEMTWWILSFNGFRTTSFKKKSIHDLMKNVLCKGWIQISCADSRLDTQERKKVHQRKSRIRLYSADSFMGQMKLIRCFNKMLSTPKNLSKCCSVKWSKFFANFPWENVKEKKQTCTTHHLHSFNCKFNRFGHCF